MMLDIGEKRAPYAAGTICKNDGLSFVSQFAMFAIVITFIFWYYFFLYYKITFLVKLEKNNTFV